MSEALPPGGGRAPTPVVRLILLTPPVARATADADALERLTGARLDMVADRVRQAVAQTEAHQGRTGAPVEWTGFLAVDEAMAGQVVGVGGYVNAPDAAGAVEIAYGVFPPFEGRGYGGAIAGALIARAVASGLVRLLYAHTLPEPNASSRILARHGFRRTGTAHDEDAGLVWRWERAVEPPAA